MGCIKRLIAYSVLQLPKAPVKNCFLGLLMMALCAFLSISINLRQTVRDNVRLLNEEFDVMAIPTFMASVDKQGNMVESSASDNYQGYMATYAKDFDLSVIENAAGVKDILVHNQFGVYLKEEKNLVPGEAMTRNTYDIAIFTYNGTEPLTAEQWSSEKIDMTVVWSARGYHELPKEPTGMMILNTIDEYTLKYRWKETIEELGLNEMWPVNEHGFRNGSFILQPGKTYIASVNWTFVISERNGLYVPGKDYLHWAEICVDQGHSKQKIRYEGGGFYAQQDPSAFQVSFPCIMPYSEEFWDTDAGAYFQDAVEICQINGSSLTAVATDDLSMYQPFYNGKVYISHGRTFSDQDYKNGNKVCIVSKNLAEQNGWEIGHKLEMSFFEALYGYNVRSVDTNSFYEPLVQHYDELTGDYFLDKNNLFFDEGVFEIIGFYDGNVTKSHFSKDIQYTREEGIDRRNIFIPKASVVNQPKVPLSKYNTTVVLDDELYVYFMSDMEVSGLLEQQKGKYQLSFDIYDQGAGGIKQSLRQLDVVSRLTLYVAGAATVVVIGLLAVLTVLQNRKQIATLRSLGVTKRQIPAAILSGILLVCLLSTIIGGIAGHLLSNRVAEYILDTAQADLADTSFSATLAKGTTDRENQFAVAIYSRPIVAVLSVVFVWTILTLLCCVLIIPETKKSPMLTLGVKE